MKTKNRRSCAHVCAAAGPFALALGLIVSLGISAPPQKQSYTTWSDYGGSPDSMQYSGLKQITKANVKQVELAWTFLAPGPSGRFAFSPLVVDGVMYVVGKDNAVFALDATSGKQIWTHPVSGHPYDRGFNYWENKDRSDRRLIFPVDSYLQEVNAVTGVSINTFGKDGHVDLREGLGRDPKTIRNIQSGTPGKVFENLIILGSATGEDYGSPPGDLRAYDVRTGKLVWTFHTVPRPGEYGYDTWPKDAWKNAGGVNAWGEVSLDEKRGIIYFPLGSATYDFYGADRKGADLYANCLLALDARTGKRLWHFQAVHHDLWDYDLATAPKLLTVRHSGKMVDVVVQGTKFGFLYVFNRVTGEPLWPIEERPVPRSDVPGEESWPTQPFPTQPPPYARQRFTVDDINPYIDADERAQLRETLLNARNEGVFTPQTLTRDQISIPGELGGTNWAGIAGDPTTGMVYVRTIEGPAIHKLNQRSRAGSFRGGTPEQQGHAVYAEHCGSCHGPDRSGLRSPKELGSDGFRAVIRQGQGEMPGFPQLTPQNVNTLEAYLNNPAAGALPPGRGGPPMPPPPEGQTRYFGQFGNLMHASNGLPVIAPPWSEIVAYDLNKGTIKWRVPLGTVSSLAEKGIKNTGAYRPTRNGPVVTAGGLIFVGTGSDRSVRAYDKDTGQVLWEKEIEANPDGIPAVYEAGGRQYIAFFAGGFRSYKGIAWKPGKPEAQGYYVFALPKGVSISKR
jgi:quinoprotein glucose dehydrogenase